MKMIPCLIFVFTVAVLLALPAQAGPMGGTFSGVLDTTYKIEEQEVHLIGGRAEIQAAPGSATKITTTVFGKPVFGDLNGDGLQDAALFLIYDPGGSGTFYYVAAAIAKNGTYQGTNAVLLGNRVAPQTIQIRNGLIITHYADRRPNEAMATPPSIAKTMYLAMKGGHLEAIKGPR